MADGSVFLGYFCNEKLNGSAKYSSGKGFELCDLLKEYPFDLRIFRYINEAEGFFVDGLANGKFTIIFKDTHEYVLYQGYLKKGMFDGVGRAELRKKGAFAESKSPYKKKEAQSLVDVIWDDEKHALIPQLRY